MWFVLFSLFAFTLAEQCDTIHPFEVKISDEVLSDLKTRLANTKLPNTILDDKDWSYGSDLQYMKDFLEHWKTKYDWRKAEVFLNQMLQFTTEIDGLKIHFVHAKSKYSQAQPLIMVHGWPGSFFECHKVIPMLTDPVAHGGKEEDAFHVVCPSLPGYGFSGAPTRKGFDQMETAKVFIKLMQRLGYGSAYWAQGGDWEAVVTLLMSHLDKNVIGYHTNFPISGPVYKRGISGLLKTVATFVAPSLMLQPSELEKWKSFSDVGALLSISGYFHLQATKPQTPGYALNDSPIGLAAYIIEKFQYWSDCHGDIDSRFSKDDLITNIMIYWVTGTITSSMRFYYEFFHGENKVFELLESVYVETPTAVANFPIELTGGVRMLSEYVYNIVQWSVFESGGHFAALEEPKLLVDDIWKFRRLLATKPKPTKGEV